MQSKSLRVLLAGATILIFAVGSAQAQSKTAPKAGASPAPASSSSSSSFPRFSVGANMGAGASPTAAAGTFNLGFEVPIEFNNNWAVGPWMQIGMAEDFVDLFVSLNTRYSFDLFDGPNSRKLRPYMQGGLGIAYARQNPFDGDTEFLINMGVGAEYAVSDHVFLGSDVMVNTMPTAPAGAAYVVSWQFARLRYRF